MPSVLILGVDPYAIPGMDGDAVQATLFAELDRFAEAGIEASMTLVGLDESAIETLGVALVRQSWDVVVVGGGIRKPEPLLGFFETVVNLIRQVAPQAAIAFNSSGGDSLEAAQRWF